MNILLISECSKRALPETRRVLDQFAERCGERTWQTSITNLGLNTLYRLLKKTARKNTAVSCRWVRSRNHTELLWIVGDRSKFNEKGAVPTNTTERNILKSASENNWISAKYIELATRLAALFHDFGKSCEDFQKKLKSNKPERNYIRHELISVRIFRAFVNGDDDEVWLNRLINKDFGADWAERLIRDGLDKKPEKPLESPSSLVSFICWLIVSHHKLPSDKSFHISDFNKVLSKIDASWCRSGNLKGVAVDGYWEFPSGIPSESKVWLNHASKVASEIIKFDRVEIEQYQSVMARMTLMLSDHIYSSLKEDDDRFKGDNGFELYANTDRGGGELKQKLDEHLIGLDKYVKRIMHYLPAIRDSLPAMSNHKSFKKRNSISRFKWQDKAYDLACSVRERSNEAGFFGINMASTGCGKTIANGRIVYGLSSPEKGARFSIALGLRTLTLQTGDSYREMLNLDDQTLGVLVGGGAVKELYNYQQSEKAATSSESDGELIPEDSYVHFEGNINDTPIARWFKNTRGVSPLLNAPVLACTIDHLIPASEGIAGGKQIAPMLRLMTSDLILDEPDDFDTNDLYALSRLVHFAGLCGSRVLLSSATITPSIAEGLFRAYESGRREFNRNRVADGYRGTVCGWFDENGCHGETNVTVENFAELHKAQVDKRVSFLNEQSSKVRAEIMPVTSVEGLADDVLNGAVRLHELNCEVDRQTGCKVSLGIVRIANINPLINLVKKFASIDKPDDCFFHICCYHSQFPLALRSNIEKALDRLAKRGGGVSFCDHPEVFRNISKHKDKANHIFIVFASPVAEVGRDHDYDWAIVEPSSMRSIIQLAGRVRRHRNDAYENLNILIMDKNIKALGDKNICYEKPGFESKDFSLDTKSMAELLREDEYKTINSVARISENIESPAGKLSDLEHTRLRQTLMNSDNSRVLSADMFWETEVWLSGSMQLKKPFRNGEEGDEYVLKVDEDGKSFHAVDNGVIGREVTVSKFDTEQLELNDSQFFINMDYSYVIEELADTFCLSLEKACERYGRFIIKYNSDLPIKYNDCLGYYRED